MSKALLHHHKHGVSVYDAGGSPTKTAQAYWRLFKSNDMGDGYGPGKYYHIAEDDTEQLALLAQVRTGDIEAAQMFIQGRSDYEYERTELLEMS